jgi:hypothetical protein
VQHIIFCEIRRPRGAQNMILENRDDGAEERTRRASHAKSPVFRTIYPTYLDRSCMGLYGFCNHFNHLRLENPQARKPMNVSCVFHIKRHFERWVVECIVRPPCVLLSRSLLEVVSFRPGAQPLRPTPGSEDRRTSVSGNFCSVTPLGVRRRSEVRGKWHRILGIR